MTDRTISDLLCETRRDAGKCDAKKRFPREVRSPCTVPAPSTIEAEHFLLYALHFYTCSHTGWLRDLAKAAIDSGIALFVSEWDSTHAEVQPRKIPEFASLKCARGTIF